MKNSKIDFFVRLYPDQEFLKADGFDDAVIGYDSTQSRLVYDRYAMAEILMRDEGITEDEAWEYLEFNVFHQYLGENTPVFVETGFKKSDNLNIKILPRPSYLVMTYDKNESILDSTTYRKKPTKKELQDFLFYSGGVTVQLFKINPRNPQDYQFLGVQK